MDEREPAGYQPAWQFELVGCLVVTLPLSAIFAFVLYRIAKSVFGLIFHWLRQSGRPDHGASTVPYLAAGSVFAVIATFFILTFVLANWLKVLAAVACAGDRLNAGIVAILKTGLRAIRRGGGGSVRSGEFPTDPGRGSSPDGTRDASRD